VNVPELTVPFVALVRSGATGRPLPRALPEPDAGAWEDLLLLARKHEVGPLLHAAVGRSPLAAPGPVYEGLRQAARVSEVRAARALDQLAGVVTALNARGIQPLLLKGALFSFRYYGSPGLRPFGDLDLLVPAAACEDAVTALEAIGYHTALGRDRAGQEYLLEDEYHRALCRKGGLKLEVHWSLLHPESRIQLDLEALWRRSEEVTSPGGRARAFSPEDEVVFMAVHAAKHQFRMPFRHLADLAALLTARAALDWERVWREGDACNAGREVAAYLGAACELGVAELPEAVRRKALESRRRREEAALLARYAVEWPFFEHPHGIIEMLASRSPASILRSFGEILFGAGAPGPSSENPAAPTSPRAPGPPNRSPRGKRWLGHLRRLRTDGDNIHAAALIRDRFRDI